MTIKLFGDHEYEIPPRIQAVARARRDIPDAAIIKHLCAELAMKMLEEGIIETVTEPDENDYEIKYVSVSARCLKRIKR